MLGFHGDTVQKLNNPLFPAVIAFFVIIFCILGFIGGFFVAGLNRSIERNALTWRLCQPQQSCKEQFETKDFMEKNSTCLFSSGNNPLKEPPGNVVECVKINAFHFYVLLEDGTIWDWEFPYPGDFGFPSESYVLALVGIILGIIVSNLLAGSPKFQGWLDETERRIRETNGMNRYDL